MRAFITGIGGFVGSRLATKIADAGGAVLGTTRNGAAAEHPPACSGSIAVTSWDIAKPADAALQSAFAAFRPDAVFHLAAISHPPHCGKHDPTPEAWAINVDGTQHVIDLVAGVSSRPRLVFPGTAHEYAQVTAENPRVNEDSPLDPAGAYGKTKLAAERLVSEAARAGRIDAVLTRCFHHTGPDQPRPALFPDWIDQLLDPACEVLEVQTLDFHLDAGDVRDMLRAFLMLAERGANGRVYNIGSGAARSGPDWLQAVLTATGSTKPVRNAERPGRTHPIADISRITSEIGWKPEILSEQTLRDMVTAARQRLNRG